MDVLFLHVVIAVNVAQALGVAASILRGDIRWAEWEPTRGNAEKKPG